MSYSQALVRRLRGLETEFGVTAPFAPEWTPCEANARFLMGIKPEWLGMGNEYEKHHEHITLDIEDEPWAREISAKICRRLYRMLPNGACLYLDGTHAEYSSPPCNDTRNALLWNRAGYALIDEPIVANHEKEGRPFKVYRNNVAREKKDSNFRTSFACHENYTALRRIPIKTIIQRMIPWLVLRLPIIGSGKVGSDISDLPVRYQISQRADFFYQPCSVSTMSTRGIYNLRDEPLADPLRFRRIHVILSDSNMLELPEYLKLGLTSILLSMMEDNQIDSRFELANPVKELRLLSRDINLEHNVSLANNEERLVVDCLKEYADLFANYQIHFHPDDQEMKDVIKRFQNVVDMLGNKNWDTLYGKLDWVTKKLIIEQSFERKWQSWNDHQAEMADIKYHDNNHRKSILSALFSDPRCVRILTQAEIDTATNLPPQNRSKFIARALQQYPKEVCDFDCFESISFKGDIIRGSETFNIVSFHDPNLQWTDDMESLFAPTVKEFLEAIRLHLGDRVRITTQRIPTTLRREANSIEWHSLPEEFFEDVSRFPPSQERTPAEIDRLLARIMEEDER